MYRCGAGAARGETLAQAAEAAVNQALVGLGDRSAALLCVFLADEPGPVGDVLAAVGLAGPSVLGAGVRGALGPGLEAELGVAGRRRPEAAAWAVAGDLSVRLFHLETMRTGDSLAVLGQPPTSDETAAMLLLADPWTFPVDGFLQQVTGSWPGLPVTGGLVAGAAAGSARLAVGGTVAERGAVGAVLGGDVSVEPVVGQGCRPVGPPLTVTAAEGGRIIELAGRPAAGVLRENLAEEVGARPFLGLADVEQREEHAFGGFVLRSVIGADDSGLLVNDALPVGCTVRFHVLDAEVAEADLCSLLWEVRQRPWVSDLAGALVVSGSERDEALFGESGRDARLVGEQWSTEAVAGFVTDGPIGPTSGGNFVHTAAASILGVGVGSGVA